MIPGALVALILAELLDREDAECGLIAAFGAVGIGFGGQETYGQTVGLSFQPEIFWWAILGFAIKGAVWGMLGGAVMGLALARERFRAMDIVAGCGLMALGTYVGWKLINEPKLIYFSNRFDKPRAELYAGLLFGALALLVWMAWRGNSKVPLRFALWGALGGGVGFASGAWIQVIGRSIQPHIWVGWWKVMELTFGACLGLAYGLCAWRNREDLKRTGKPTRCDMRSWLSVALGLAVIAATLVLYEKLPSRLPYTILGAALLSLALAGEPFAWQTAITMTACAFFLDLAKAKPQFGAVTLALCVAMGTLAVAVYAAWRPCKRTMLMLLMWSSVGVALLKLFLPPAAKGEGPAVMGGLFVLMAAAVSAMVIRLRVAAVCAVLLALLLAPTSARGVQPLSGATLEWTLDLGQPAAGGPVQFGRADTGAARVAESREVAVEGGRRRDSFAPFGVHMYRLQPAQEFHSRK
jgi:hypothetical protein